jgi:hypothetical protein
VLFCLRRAVTRFFEDRVRVRQSLTLPGWNEHDSQLLMTLCIGDEALLSPEIFRCNRRASIWLIPPAALTQQVCFELPNDHSSLRLFKHVAGDDCALWRGLLVIRWVRGHEQSIRIIRAKGQNALRKKRRKIGTLRRVIPAEKLRIPDYSDDGAWF